jgi:hypothetical protein
MADPNISPNDCRRVDSAPRNVAVLELDLAGRFDGVKASVTLGEIKATARTTRGQDRRCRIIARALALETIRAATGNVQSLRIVYRSIQVRRSFCFFVCIRVGHHIRHHPTSFHRHKANVPLAHDWIYKTGCRIGPVFVVALVVAL